MAVTDDLPITLGRTAISLTHASDVIDRATRLAPISVPLGGEATLLGFARWAIASPDSGTKTFVAIDPAGGGGPVGFDTQLRGMYVLLERTGESFKIASTIADTQTIGLATWSSSLVAGEIFQLRRTAPGTTYSAFSYRASVASVLPPPPGIPIQDAEVTGVSGTTITVRDGWLVGGAGPVTVDGQQVGRSVRLSELVAVDAITDFQVIAGAYVYSFADVSAYQVGDWMRRAAETDGGFSHVDINTLITPAFPAAMEIVDVDTGANTVTVVSRDGLHRVIFDTAEFGPDYNIIRIYRPNATLRTVTASTASPKTLTLDSVSGFSIGGGDGAVEILIATTSTSGKVPWFLEHPTYIQAPPTGIGVKARTIDRSQAPTAYLGVQNLVRNPIGRIATTPGALPDGWLGAQSLGQVGTATPANFVIAKNIDPMFIKVGAQSWFFSTTNGVIYFPPIPWTAMYASQRFSTRLPLLMTAWAGNAALVTLQWGIMQADGTVMPWYDQPRSVIIQPATSVSPRPDPPFRKFVANVWDDLVLNDFDITEPSTYPVTNRPNAGDIANMGAGLGLVPCLVINGGGTTVEFYVGGIAVVQAHEAPANVQEFYEANLLHQDTNAALRKAGPPQPKISVDFYDVKAMNPALDEPAAKKGVMALIDGVGLGTSNFRRRITDVKRNPNEPGRTQIIFDETVISLATATAKAPPTKPTTGGTGGGTTSGGSNQPAITLSASFNGTVPVITATVSAGVVKVRFAGSLAPATAPTIDEVRVGTLDLTPPFQFSGPALSDGDVYQVAALAYDNNGVESGLATLTVPYALVTPWFYGKPGVNMVQGVDHSAGTDGPASDSAGDRVAFWKDANGNGRKIISGLGFFGTYDSAPTRTATGAIDLGLPASGAGTCILFLPDMSALTEAVIMYRLRVNNASVQNILGLMDTSNVTANRILYPDSDGHIKSGFGSAGQTDFGDPASVIPGVDLTAWNTFEEVVSATVRAAKLNGVTLASGAPAFGIGFTSAPRLSGSLNAEEFFGQIESLVILSPVPSDAELAVWRATLSGATVVDGGDDGDTGGGISGSSFAPTKILDTETFTVPANKQVLIALPIDNEGTLVNNGALVMVD